MGQLINLLELELDGNSLTGTIPAELGNLVQLQWLWLNNNHLTGSFPSQLGNLTELKRLNLGWNQLSGEIPDEIGNLLELKFLDLSNNELSGDIPESFTNLVKLEVTESYFWFFYGLRLGYNRLNTTGLSSELDSFLETKNPGWKLTQAITQVIGSAGGSLTSQDGNVIISVPPGAILDGTIFDYKPIPYPENVPDNLKPTGISFLLTVWDSSDNPITQFEVPVNLTISYGEPSFPFIDERYDYLLYRWDENDAKWVDSACAGSDYERFPGEDKFSIDICHLSEFAVLGRLIHVYTFPLILR